MPPSNSTMTQLPGSTRMDHEHALELQMVRALQAALTARRSPPDVVLMDQLEIFANAHFLAEQHLMSLHAYPGFESHQLEHDRLIAELRELSAVSSAIPMPTPTEVETLERWMLTHIHTEDEALGRVSADGVGYRGARLTFPRQPPFQLPG